MFVVDQDGKLASVEARGKLEQLLPELLARKAEKCPPAADDPGEKRAMSLPVRP